MALPIQAFCHLLAPFESKEIQHLEWLGSKKAMLNPTRVTETLKEFRYVVAKPGQVNRLFNLGEWDYEIPGAKWRRGYRMFSQLLTH